MSSFEFSGLVSLDAVYKEICRFREETGQDPSKIHLTEYEIARLNLEKRESLIADRRRELKERLRPDLLPPMREHQDIAYHDYVYGVEIVPSETGGHFQPNVAKQRRSEAESD